MRRISASLLLWASALAAQPAVDVSAAAGGVVTKLSETFAPSFAPIGTVGVSVPSGLPRGIRLAGAVAYGPGEAESGDGRTFAVSLGAEAPLSGGRNGVYLALGAGYVAFDNADYSGCRIEIGCMYEGGGTTPPYDGVVWTAGVGARVPVGSRWWIEPAVSAMVWDAPLLSARVGAGWRLR